MNKLITSLRYTFLLSLLAFSLSSWTFKNDINNPVIELINKYRTNYVYSAAEAHTLIYGMYDSLDLEEKGLSHEAYTAALDGYLLLKDNDQLSNDSILTIIDFDQPSYNKRLYIIDIKNQQLLFNTWVAHGRNSGEAWATSFSNKPESHKSSLGFYITNNTYNGGNGYSLKLTGLEKSLNDRAFQRAIVVHGASYVSESNINGMGYIGRSHGCPAVPTQFTRPIIDKIKNGSCLFIYNKQYNKALLNGDI